MNAERTGRAALWEEDGYEVQGWDFAKSPSHACKTVWKYDEDSSLTRFEQLAVSSLKGRNEEG